MGLGDIANFKDESKPIRGNDQSKWINLFQVLYDRLLCWCIRLDSYICACFEFVEASMPTIFYSLLSMQNIDMLTNSKSEFRFVLLQFGSLCWLSASCLYVLDVFPVFYADHSYVTLALPYNVTAQTIVDSIEDHTILGDDCLLCEVTSTGGLKINTLTL